MKNRSFNKRLVFALNGLGTAWLRESSFRVQTGLAACAVFVLIALQPPLVWWAVVTITIALVLAIELVNSAFEALVDHLHPDIHPEIRIIKDMAAGSVLLLAAGANVVGLLLLAANMELRSKSGRTTRSQVNEPIDAADQPASTNDIADGDWDKAGKESRPRQCSVVSGVEPDLRPQIRRSPHFHEQAEGYEIHVRD